MLTIENVSFQDAVQYLLHNGIQRHFGKKYQQDFGYNFLTATKQLTPIGWCAQQSRYSNDWDKLNVVMMIDMKDVRLAFLKVSEQVETILVECIFSSVL